MTFERMLSTAMLDGAATSRRGLRTSFSLWDALERRLMPGKIALGAEKEEEEEEEKRDAGPVDPRAAE